MENSWGTTRLRTSCKGGGIGRVLIVLLGMCRVIECQSRKFIEFRDKLEGKVRKIAEAMEQLYQRRCSEEMARCPRKSFNSCKGVGRKVCNSDYPKPEQCLDEGACVSEASAVKFPNNLDFDDLDGEERSLVCTSAFLEDTFFEIEYQRNKEFTLAYFSTKEGISRFYPGAYFSSDGACNSYDPRFRPWFITSSTLAKNTLILVDSTSQMRPVMHIAKQVAMNLIRRLSISESVAVLAFGVQTKSLRHSTVRKATEMEKQAMQERVMEISPGGQEGLVEGLDEALFLLEKSYQEEEVSPCANAENVIFLITNGQPGTVNVQKLQDLIKSYQRRIILMIVAVGPNPNRALLKQLACRVDGIMVEMPMSLGLSATATKLNQFYQFLSINSTLSKPLWTDPYIDVKSSTKLITVSMPAFYKADGSSYSEFLGVADPLFQKQGHQVLAIEFP